MCVMETMASAQGLSSDLTLSRDPVFGGTNPLQGAPILSVDLSFRGYAHLQ